MNMYQTVKSVIFGCVAILIASYSHASQQPPYEIVGDEIPMSLSGTAGDPANGKKVVVNRKQGNCLACHGVSDLAAHPYHGIIGPHLDGVSERYSEAQLRLLLVNSKKVVEDTIMPSFYSEDGKSRVSKKFQGKTILTAQQVEDVLAYLLTLK